MLFCEPHNEAFYQARGWHPFQGEVYAEQPGGKNSLRSDGAICVRFHPQAARRNHRPMRPAVVTPARCAGGLHRRRPDNMSAIIYCDLDDPRRMTIDAPLDTRPAAVPSAPVNGLLDLADPADAAEARAAQCDRHGRHHAGCGGRDLLYRPARHRAARRHRAGVSLRDADADDVGGRDGRRRFLRDQPRDRRRRSRPRGDAGAACRDDRRLRRNLLHR